MLPRFLKSFVPKPVKHYVAARVPGSKVRQQMELEAEESLIRAQIQKEIAKGVFDFSPKVLPTTAVEPKNSTTLDASSNAGIAIKSNPIFRDFLGQYQKLRQNPESPEFISLKQEYPVCVTMAEQMTEYFGLCNTVVSPIAQSMKRVAYTVVPFYNSSKAVNVFNKELPRVGLLSHPNSQPKEFILDALNGLAAPEEVTSEFVVSHTWANRPYDYLRNLREQVKEQMVSLPGSFFEYFPSKEWFVEQVTYSLQCEIGLNQLLEQSRWKAMITGDALSSLCLALSDVPREKRPPIIYFAHGVTYGYPISTMFMKADYAFARGRRDEGFMVDLGFPKENIIKVGSQSHEAFPVNQILEQQRIHARMKCGVADDTPILVLALPWDSYLFKTRPAPEVQDWLIEFLTLVAKKWNGKRPILYLKYHPHPVNEPGFSTSRSQYPFNKFLQLIDHGYTVRLAKTFDDCMPAADCFMSHESSVLCDAVANGLPTISFDYNPPYGRPSLNHDSYSGNAVHKIFGPYENPDTISDGIISLMTKPREEVWERCRQDWSSVFDCGRSEGLARVTDFFTKILGI